MKKSLLLNILILFLFIYSGCSNYPTNNPPYQEPTNNPGLGNDDTSYGDDLEINKGDFVSGTCDVKIECLSGTPNCYTISNNVITFTDIVADSIYSITGKLDGSIVIDPGNDYKFELELTNFAIKNASINPITILSGEEVSIQAKKDTTNYIYDNREVIDESDTSLYSGIIHSEVDLEISGKGNLIVASQNNNGIHSKDDLQIKNLNLTVLCCDNALKGNDSVEISCSTLTLISTTGDGIKTTNSDISQKGKQRGTISITDSVIDIFSAADGIDSAYNVIIDHQNTKLNIYTDKYSNYSKEVTTSSISNYYIRSSNNYYKYSVKYYNTDDDYVFVNALYHSTVGGMGKNYYYHSLEKKTGYNKMQIFIYNSNMEQSQETEYIAKSELLSINDVYDTIAISNRNNEFTLNWTNYTTSIMPSGPGGGRPGMDEGNKDKGDHSTKGIKAANEIIINNGLINIKSYDDALHANKDTTLENGLSPIGSITINDGTLTIYSNDDGVHADGTLLINNGSINITNSYEGLEGEVIKICGGSTWINSKDDGVNATTTSGTGVILNGGYLYVYATGDGIDSNSKTNYTGILFDGCNVIVISSSNGNSAIDTERGYTYTSGNVIAIMSRGGMTNEATHCSNFSSIGKNTTMSFTSGQTIKITGDFNTSFTMPCSISNAFVVFLNKNNNLSN